jgi:hypothetical protein
MTLAYSEGLNISNQDCKNIRQCFTGYNSIYDIATIPFVLLRPYQNASQMVTKIPENSDKLSIILASLKILGALLAFTSLTIKGLAKIREPVTKSVLYLPKKAINCFKRQITHSPYLDLEAEESRAAGLEIAASETRADNMLSKIMMKTIICYYSYPYCNFFSWQCLYC